MTQPRIILYGFHDTVLGRVLFGLSLRGLCWLGFVMDHDDGAVQQMKRRIKAQDFVESANITPSTAAKHDNMFQNLPVNVCAIKVAIDNFTKHNNATPPPLDIQGTPFQQSVWAALLDIPRGQTISYKDIAHILNKPTAARAVGGAVGANPISLFIPCHRVLTHDGKIGGYAWGVARKVAILNCEENLNS